jgi:hypothetical protein
MSAIGGPSGQVLGATTAIASGVAILPATGQSWLGQLLSYAAIIVGSLVVISHITTRVIKRYFI